jgi:hypothetical protein
MKLFRLLPRLFLILLAGGLCAAQEQWQTGRIVDITHSTNRHTASWMVNTPLTEDEKVCTISVHVADRVYWGSYSISKAHPPPPQEWVTGHPVNVQIAGDHMFLRVPQGEDLKLKIFKKKSAKMMQPLTPREIANQKMEENPAGQPSMVGFDKTGTREQPEAEPPAQPAQPDSQEAGSVTVSISSVPYLADIYVDGQNAGYTPAKLKLFPGKHTIRCEKKGYQPWTKEITASGSELTLDATLTPSKK